MSTSVRDLLDAVYDQLEVLRTSEPAPAATQDALLTIAAVGPIVAGLRSDGVDNDPDGIRQHAVTSLAAACTAVARGCDGLTGGRAAELIGASGDAISRLRRDTGNADRWALALAFGDTVRHASSVYRERGPDSPNNHVQWARGAAVTLARTGARLPPSSRHLVIQERPIPSPTPSGASGLSVVAQAIENITDTVRRSTRSDNRDLTITELRAVGTVALVSARYVAAIAQIDDPVGKSDLVQEWMRVRHSLSAIDDGITPATSTDSRILRWVTRAHDGLSRALGPPDQLDHAAVARLTSLDRRNVIAIAACMPATAELMRLSLLRQTPFYARAKDLQRDDQGLDPRIKPHFVPLDGPDAEHIETTFRRSATASESVLRILRDGLPKPSEPRAREVQTSASGPRREATLPIGSKEVQLPSTASSPNNRAMIWLAETARGCAQIFLYARGRPEITSTQMIC